MNFANIDSPEQLEALGTVEEVRLALEKFASPFKVQAQSYEELFPYVMRAQPWSNPRTGHFVSRQAEVIFFLTMLTGKIRNDFLEVKEEYFSDHEAAKGWFRRLVSIVHPDKTGGDSEAFKELTKLYEEITYVGADGDE